MSHTRRIVTLVIVLFGPALATAQSQTRQPDQLRGIVRDETGAILPDATVDLVDASGATVQSVRTTTEGAFELTGVKAGDYELRIGFPGFKSASKRVRVGRRAVAPLEVVLTLADVKQEVTVASSDVRVDTSGAANQDAVLLDQDLLATLPIFDQDVIAAASRFLDAAALGTGGVSIVVNGMEVSSLQVSASAIQQIKINQDPYSAEYSRPGRGRIEILTKPGSQQYHGETNVILRDARFNARNPFATTKPPERRRILEGSVGGPVAHTRALLMTVSAYDHLEDQQVPVFALGLTGSIRTTAPQRNRRSLVSGSITYQHSDRTTISIRPAYRYQQYNNRGVGGTTLPSAGTDFEHREEQVTYLHQTILRPTLVNQFQILGAHEREPATNTSNAPGLVVAGAFVGGGGQGELLRTERHIQLMESIGWTRGRHLIAAGFQLPDWSRRGFYDRTNTGGTFYFASLDAYAEGHPYAFTQQRGEGDLVFLEKLVGTYVKDDWQVRPGLTTSFGLRYDWQNYFHDNNNASPRVSMAYAPGDQKTTVVRAGAGLFTDRSGPVVIADLLQYQTGRLARYVVTDPSYPNPFASMDALNAQPPSAVRFAPGIQLPRTFQYSVGVDRQLRNANTVSVSYVGAHGGHLFRSRDVNAPLPPLYAARPDALFGAIRQIESTGRQKSDSVTISMRGKPVRWFTGQAQYTWARAWNDTNGMGSYPANDYDVSGEWGRADFDRRHRLLVLGRVTASRFFDAGISVTTNSGAPYSELVGADIFNNGRGLARPAGVARNTLEGARYAAIDVRLSRDIKFGKERAVSVAVDGFNLLNHVNYTSYVGTLGSALFGRPVGARDPRQAQVTLRVKF